MNRLLLFVSIYAALSSGIAQINTIEKLPRKIGITQTILLPSFLSETSGLCSSKEGLWTINDSGNDPKIFRLLLDTIKTASAQSVQKIESYRLNIPNIDWEAIETDGTYLYIGDFGNNKGNRKDLCIYRIPISNLLSESQQIKDDRYEYSGNIESMKFQFAEQKSFKKRRLHSFDCESMLVQGDSITLFTKNWNNPNTYIYQFAWSTAFQVIKRVDCLRLGFLSTDVCQDERKLIFCGYNARGKQFLSIYPKGDGKKSNTFTIDIKPGQIEGITVHEQCVYLTTEKRKSQKQALLILPVLQRVVDAGG